MHAKLNYRMPFRSTVTNITSPVFAKSGFSLTSSLPLLCSLRQKDPGLEMTLSFTEPSDFTAQEVRKKQKSKLLLRKIVSFTPFSLLPLFLCIDSFSS